MIPDLFLIIIILMMKIVNAALSAINFVVPDQISDSLTSILSNLNYLSGILPIGNIMEALGFLALFEAVWFTAKWAMKIWAAMPFVGKKVKLHGD